MPEVDREAVRQEGATERTAAGESAEEPGEEPSGPRVVVLAEAARQAILEEGRLRYPEECCGGLLGTIEGSRRRVIVRAVPVWNEEEDLRERRYLVGPREVMRMEDEAEQEDLELLGFFHSHPDHPAQPSETDRRLAWPWYSYMILSVHQGEPRKLRSWRLVDDRSTFEEEVVNGTEGANREP
ncbi:MAG: M67 family metallopeptidase [Longimicrobiales bacterium]